VPPELWRVGANPDRPSGPTALRRTMAARSSGSKSKRKKTVYTKMSEENGWGILPRPHLREVGVALTDKNNAVPNTDLEPIFSSRSCKDGIPTDPMKGEFS